MLKRRSIKTKLVVALACLLASVGVLTISSVLALKRYRNLAEQFRVAVGEFRCAGDLYRLAETLSDGSRAANAARRRSGIYDHEPLPFQMRWLDRRGAEVALEGFERNLASYAEMAAAGRPDSLLLEDDERRENVEAIRQAFGEVKSRWSHLGRPGASAADLETPVQDLVDATKNHVELLTARSQKLTERVKGTYRTWKTVTVVCAVIAVVLIGLLLWSFWATLVQPFRTLLDGSRLVAKGEFGHRIYLETGDELNELADAMNDMCAKFSSTYTRLDMLRKNLEKEVRDRTREVIRNEQLASVGFLAAGVAHEINNPLTTIAWAAESLETQLEEFGETPDATVDADLAAALQATLRQIQGEAFRCKGITDRLLDFSRMSEVRREPTDLSKLVQDVVELVSKVGEFRCKTIRTDCREPVVAHVSAHQIRQVVLNLVTNALESVDAEGAVEITVRGNGTHAFLSVVDDGCGMSEDVLQHLFEPFFTRRRDGTGTGLGLSITYRIVSQHGGKLIPSSDGEGHGSRMDLVLPLIPEPDSDVDDAISNQGWNHESYQAA